jgi:hypothetical protein
MTNAQRYLDAIHTLLAGEEHSNYILFKQEREKLYLSTPRKTPFNIYWGKILSKLRAKHGYRIPSRRETRLQKSNRESKRASYADRQLAKERLDHIDKLGKKLD